MQLNEDGSVDAGFGSEGCFLLEPVPASTGQIPLHFTRTNYMQQGTGSILKKLAWSEIYYSFRRNFACYLDIF